MIVVADTSVILNLCRIEHEFLLRRLYQRVLIPKVVTNEFERLTKTQPRFSGLILPQWIEVLPEPELIPQEIMQAELGAGESAAITLCLKEKADALLIDELLGRALAARLKLRTIGILGVLTDAKSLGAISNMKNLIDRLQTEANFWISADLKRRVLQAVGE
jgi:predicted nucleic acid-binding protein